MWLDQGKAKTKKNFQKLKHLYRQPLPSLRPTRLLHGQTSEYFFEQLMVMAVVDKCFHTYLAFPFDLLTAPLPPTKCLTKNHILFYNYISVFE